MRLSFSIFSYDKPVNGREALIMEHWVILASLFSSRLLEAYPIRNV